MLKVQTLVLLERPTHPVALVDRELRLALGVDHGADLAAVMHVRFGALEPDTVPDVLLGARALPCVIAQSDREVEVLRVKSVLDKAGFISCVTEASGLRSSVVRLGTSIRRSISGTASVLRGLREGGTEGVPAPTSADLRASVRSMAEVARESSLRVVAGVVALGLVVGLPAALLWWLAQAGAARDATGTPEAGPGLLALFGPEAIVMVVAFLVGLPAGLLFARVVTGIRQARGVLTVVVAVVGIGSVCCLALSLRSAGEPAALVAAADAGPADAEPTGSAHAGPTDARSAERAPDSGQPTAKADPQHPFGTFVASLERDRPPCGDIVGRFNRRLCQFEHAPPPASGPEGTNGAAANSLAGAPNDAQREPPAHGLAGSNPAGDGGGESAKDADGPTHALNDERNKPDASRKGRRDPPGDGGGENHGKADGKGSDGKKTDARRGDQKEADGEGNKEANAGGTDQKEANAEGADKKGTAGEGADNKKAHAKAANRNRANGKATHGQEPDNKQANAEGADEKQVNAEGADQKEADGGGADNNKANSKAARRGADNEETDAEGDNKQASAHGANANAAAGADNEKANANAGGADNEKANANAAPVADNKQANAHGANANAARGADNEKANANAAGGADNKQANAKEGAHAQDAVGNQGGGGATPSPTPTRSDSNAASAIPDDTDDSDSHLLLRAGATGGLGLVLGTLFGVVRRRRT